MAFFKDQLSQLIVFLILISLALFFSGQLPYPVGILILTCCLIARGLYLKSRGS